MFDESCYSNCMLIKMEKSQDVSMSLNIIVLYIDISILETVENDRVYINY